MGKSLLITPPFLQPNTPYPATAYLKGFLERQGIETAHYDLSVELLNEIFSRSFLEKVFFLYEENKRNDTDSTIQGDCSKTDRSTTQQEDDKPDNTAHIYRTYSLRHEYRNSIDTVMSFLRGEDPSLAYAISRGDFLPQSSRFDDMEDPTETFGWMGVQDCAKYLCTLYLQDLSDFIRAVVTEHFEIVRYAERIAVSLPDFAALEMELRKPLNIIEIKMVELLRQHIAEFNPDMVAFTVPFPGNLLPALRCGQYIRSNFPGIKTAIGGGYPTTELRSMTDKSIFTYIDYVVFDDGEKTLADLIYGRDTTGMATAQGYFGSGEKISHTERGCPDFGGLDFGKYFSLLEVVNPMHRLWGDGRWNKMMLAHGCYWAKCAFCDTSLDYIKCFDPVPAATLVDWMEHVAAVTGSHSFHFVDEAAPPRMLRDISIEILRRGLKFTWWTNIRFEKAYTGDLCRLMASAGCIAVSGGLEVASDRLLEMIGKGITIEQATIAMRNFYYAGIMVHSYLMYGLPTQTLQESIDALEVVRQMFCAELIGSAFWHRYAMTIHSPSGQNPEHYGVRRKGSMPNSFANNEIFFADNRGYNINMVGNALRTSLAHYMTGAELEQPVHKWFETKVPQTTMEPSLITDHLIKPDGCRIYDDSARIVWIGGYIRQDAEGITLGNRTEEKHINFGATEAAFLVKAAEICSNLTLSTTLADLKKLFAQFSEESFVVFYHSKKWDTLRSYGLLQI